MTSEHQASSAKHRFDAVLFDLDGTLIDSAPGIISSLEDTFRHFGREIPGRSELIHFIGPPLIESFRTRLGLDDAAAWEMLRVYRQDYRRDGALDASVFPGVVELLHELRSRGVPLAIATSKPETQAVRILEHLEIDGYFDVICGATEDETRSTKTAIVAEALRGLKVAGHPCAHPVLVGDRIYDVEGALANAIPVVIVSWGYGSPDEFAGALTTVTSADELKHLLVA